MIRRAKPILEGYRGATPMLAVRDAANAIEFYKKAFGATESRERIVDPSGKIGHAEIAIAGARIMIADELPEHNRSPQSLGGTSVIIHLYVQDVDALAKQATVAGVKVLRPVKDEPYGRVCKFEDPFGHVWMFTTPPVGALSP